MQIASETFSLLCEQASNEAKPSFVLSCGGLFLFVNRAFAQHLDIPGDRLINQPIRKYVQGSRVPPIIAGNHTLEFRTGVPMQVAIRLVATEDCDFLLGTLHSERSPDRTTAATEVPGESADQALRRVAAGLAHELNNILSLLQLNHFLLESETHLTKRGRDALGGLNSGILRAIELSRDFGLYAGRGLVLKDEINLNELVESAIQESGLAERVLFAGLENCPTFKGDRIELLKTVETLLQAAVRVSAPQAPIAAAVERVSESGAEYLSVAITDTKGELPPANSRFFEPFFAYNLLGRGKALSMAAAAGIARQHGGKAVVKTDGSGQTTVSLLFPIRVDPQPRKPSPAGTGRVLVVENEEQILAPLSKLLQAAGFQVSEARTPVEALEILQRLPAEFLFTDINLESSLNGLELARIAQTLNPGIVTLFASGCIDEDSMKRHGLIRDLNFLPKPYDPAQLVTLLKKTRGGGTQRSVQ